jgi:hypothetical protein
MRLVRGLYLFFVLSLSLGLFYGELPESFYLNDDAANDFVEDSAGPVRNEIQEVHKDPKPGLETSFAVAPVLQPPFSRLVESTIASGLDPLRLFSVQRK